jgi:hypothetical protein
MRPRELPPLSIIEEHLSYDPETGELHWKKDRHSAKVKGKRAGTLLNGYLSVKIHGKNYFVHRVAYALYHGEQLSTDLLIDHIDGDKSNNRIDNLRKADYSENGYNRKQGVNNTSGRTGVHYVNGTGKWQARIVLSGKRVSLGYFTDLEDAITARLNAEQEHNIFVFDR